MLFARTSSTVTCAPMPTAIVAALRPTTPPPRITTRPRRVPGTPPSSTPLPPRSFSRQLAPTWTAMRPATSLIGRDGGDLRARQLARQGRFGRQVQVGVQDQPVAEVTELGGERLLHLDHHLGG